MRSRRGFYVLLGVTLLAAGAAILSQRPGEEHRTRLGLLFPDLGERVDQVQTVRIETSDHALSLARTGDGWVANNRNDYPADGERIRELVLGISRLERLEKKTDDPERYSSLDLRDIDQDGSKAVRIALLDDAGGEMLGLLVGKTRDFQASGRSRYFVRVAGEARSWLVEGVLPPVPEELRNWLQQALLPGVEQSDFRSVTIAHPDGETVEIRNQAAGSGGDFRLAGLGDGETITGQQAIDSVAATLRGLALKDVEPAGDPGSDDVVLTVTAATVDGVYITVRFTPIDKDYGARLEARYEPDDDQPDGEKDGTAGERLAAGLNKRWSSRVFVVSQYAVNSLLVRRSDLVGEPAAQGDQ